MIGVDLGTTTVRIHLKGKGVVLREPAVIAVIKGTTDVKAVGEDAYRMLGRTPGNVMAVRPMADGVIADYTLTEMMLKAFIRKVLTGPARFLRPTIMVCIPSGITEVEKRAVVQAVHEIGARKALLIEEPIAGAIGAGIRIEEPVGTMVIDVGGGTTDIAVLSMGGIVVSESLRIAGNTLRPRHHGVRQGEAQPPDRRSDGRGDQAHRRGRDDLGRGRARRHGGARPRPDRRHAEDRRGQHRGRRERPARLARQDRGRRAQGAGAGAARAGVRRDRARHRADRRGLAAPPRSTSSCSASRASPSRSPTTRSTAS
jgi:hypothetical protein